MISQGSSGENILGWLLKPLEGGLSTQGSLNLAQSGWGSGLLEGCGGRMSGVYGTPIECGTNIVSSTSRQIRNSQIYAPQTSA